MDSGACITKVADNNQLSSTPAVHQFKGSELVGLVFLCSVGKEHSVDEFICFAACSPVSARVTVVFDCSAQPNCWFAVDRLLISCVLS